MDVTRKNAAIGLLLNGTLVVIAVFSMVSGMYPLWSSWIFVGCCLLTAASLGAATKVARNSDDASFATVDDETAHRANDPEQDRQPDENTADEEPFSSIKNSIHPDIYSKIIEKLAQRTKEQRAIKIKEDFSFTLNIINVYTGNEMKVPQIDQNEKIELILRPDLQESLSRRHEIN